MTESTTTHPLDSGTTVIYDPPSVHLDNRRGEIKSREHDDWGTVYVVEDCEKEFPISIGESSIVRTVESENEPQQPESN